MSEPSTMADLWYPGGADYSFGDPMPDYVRCHTDSAASSGSVRVDLPQVEGDIGDGARLTIRNLGATHDVLVNPFSAEVIEGRTSTLRIRPGQTVTLQGGAVSTLANQGVFGWEVISLGLQPAAV